jgi:hypothetical protein
VISEILTIFKVDTSDMKAGLRDLKGEQRSLAETELAAANARNKHLEDWTKGNGKAKAGLEALKSSMMLAAKSIELLGLEGSKASEALGSMSAVMSTIGGKGGIIAGLAVGLGYAVDALGDWQHEMNQARFVQDQFEAAQHKAKDAVLQGAEAVRIAHMEMVQLSLKTTISTETMKAFTEAYLKADMVARAPWFKEQFMKDDSDIGQFKSLYADRPNENPFTYKDTDTAGVRASDRITARKEEIGLAREELAALERQWTSYEHGALSVGLYRQERERLQAVINGTVGGGAKGKPGRGDVSQYASIGGYDRVAAPIGYSNSLGQSAMYEDPTRQLIDQNEAKRTKELTDDWMSRLGASRERREGYLEAAFGPISEFDAYQQGFEALGGVFSAFSEAVGAGYEAIVTGQGSVIGALKATAAAGIMAQGKQSMISALRETALGVGAFALGSPTAAAHFKSAALHGAVAIAAGAAASALGAGGGGAPAPASSGGSGSGSGGGSSGGSSVSAPGGERELRPINIIVGEHFTEMSPRMRSQRAQEAVDKALRERDE